MYKCHINKKQFVEGLRYSATTLRNEYTEGKQTDLQVAKKFNCSKPTIQREIDLHIDFDQEKVDKEGIIFMNTIC
jgi:hypothetical protein